MSLVHRLSERLKLTPNQIYDMNFIDACNWLSYFKELDEYTKREEDRRNNRMTF